MQIRGRAAFAAVIAKRAARPTPGAADPRTGAPSDYRLNRLKAFDPGRTPLDPDVHTLETKDANHPDADCELAKTHPA
jgi:hypothetical protein